MFVFALTTILPSTGKLLHNEFAKCAQVTRKTTFQFVCEYVLATACDSCVCCNKKQV